MDILRILKKTVEIFTHLFTNKEIERKYEIYIDPGTFFQRLANNSEFTYYYKNPKIYEDGFDLKGDDFIPNKLMGTITIGSISRTNDEKVILTTKISFIGVFGIVSIIFMLIGVFVIISSMVSLQWEGIIIGIFLLTFSSLTNLSQKQKIAEADGLLLDTIREMFSTNEVRLS